MEQPSAGGSIVADPSRFYADHVAGVHVYVARRLGRDLAADVVADVFRIAFEGADRYDAERGSERAWLMGIATNRIRRHWRTEARRLRAMARSGNALERSVDSTSLVVDRIDAQMEAVRVLEAVAGLDGEDRDLLVLVAWEGCSYEEVASMLALPIGTVRSRLHRIRHKLRDAVRSAVAEEVGSDG